MPQESAESDIEGRFGTFEGVFVPTSLTILGVILFLRTGWVVGQTGLLGAVLVIGLAFAISTATALSLSSIVTSMQVGPGGAFSVIARNLGIELGGSVGIPLYLSQALAVAMYIFGFREGWRWVFPSHDPLLVDGALFAVLFAVAFVSARLAFRVQYVILAVIVGALVSIFAALVVGSPSAEPDLWRLPTNPADVVRSDALWVPFAVFFPAVTGILAGANMSGELARPDRSIPRGTLGAIAVTFVVYLAVAVAVSLLASPERLASDTRALIDVAAWQPAVLAGLLAATFSSGLSTFVGAPRILHALGRRGVVPASDWISETGDDGEPRRALLVTAAVVAAGVALRELNAIAELLTLFFLLTYAVINGVLLAHQVLGTVVFRPRFRVPWIVPVVGLVGCLGGMIVVSPVFTFVAVVAVVAIYVALLRRGVSGPHGEVRSGFALAAAEWAVRALSRIPSEHRRTWQANLLVPATEIHEVRGVRPVLTSLARPTGSIMLLGLRESESEADALGGQLDEMCERIQERGVMCRATVVGGLEPMPALRSALDVVRGTFLRPNLLFVPLARHESDDGLLSGLGGERQFRALREDVEALDLGLCLYARDPDRERVPSRYGQIDVWFTHLAVGEAARGASMSLVLLAAWKLSREWQIPLRFLACVADAEPDEGDDEPAEQTPENDEEEEPQGAAASLLDSIDPETTTEGKVRDALAALAESLLPVEVETRVLRGSMIDHLANTDERTLVFVGGQATPTLGEVREVVAATPEDCLFVCRSRAAD